MLVVGVTGHRANRLSQAEPLVRAKVREALLELQEKRPASECCIISGLADGADQIAAEEALAAGWSLHAILPFALVDYLPQMPSDCLRRSLVRLVGQASRVTIASCETVTSPTGQHYEKLGEGLVAAADALVAVWDGKESDRIGGTYHVIERAKGKPIPVFWIYSDGKSSRWLR